MPPPRLDRGYVSGESRRRRGRRCLWRIAATPRPEMSSGESRRRRGRNAALPRETTSRDARKVRALRRPRGARGAAPRHLKVAAAGRRRVGLGRRERDGARRPPALLGVRPAGRNTRPWVLALPCPSRGCDQWSTATKIIEDGLRLFEFVRPPAQVRPAPLPRVHARRPQSRLRALRGGARPRGQGQAAGLRRRREEVPAATRRLLQALLRGVERTGRRGRDARREPVGVGAARVRRRPGTPAEKRAHHARRSRGARPAVGNALETARQGPARLPHAARRAVGMSGDAARYPLFTLEIRQNAAEMFRGTPQ